MDSTTIPETRYITESASKNVQSIDIDLKCHSTSASSILKNTVDKSKLTLTIRRNIDKATLTEIRSKTRKSVIFNPELLILVIQAKNGYICNTRNRKAHVVRAENKIFAFEVEKSVSGTADA